MITTLILYLVGIFIRLLAVLLPQWEIPTIATTAWDSFVGFTAIIDVFVPMSDLLAIILIIVVYKFSLLVFRAGAGIMSLVRGGGNLNI